MPDKVNITKTKLDNLANAVAAKSGEPVLLTVDQMTDAVLGINLGEENILEGVKVNNVELPIIDKKVNIPAATITNNGSNITTGVMTQNLWNYIDGNFVDLWNDISYINNAGYITEETDPTIHILVLQEDENEELTTGEDDSISNYINNNELVIIYYDGIAHFYDKNSDRGYSFNGIDGTRINYRNNTWYGSTDDSQYYIRSYNIPTNVSQLDNDAGYITEETDPTVPSWAKASTKPSYNFSEIGSTPTTISGYGIADAYTKTQVDGLVAGVLHYKGTKAAVSNLPTSGNTTGDTWHVTADGSEWAWDGTTWQELGTAVDLSDYVTTDDSRLSDARTPTAHNQALSTITGADDLKAIEALSGTSGLLKKTAANTWSLDTNTYMQTSHAANGITSNDITNWNNKLSSYTETDPVFTASAAANISSTDISNWNSKTSNTGTVTSIGLSNATNGGLTVSNSPITNSGSITVGHSNVLSSAQTTQAVYPIKIDKNGHISAYGSAINIPTKVSDLTNDSGFISSYTETDPVFSASAAAGITSTDISNWNAKVSDDRTWNGVELAKQSTTNNGDNSYVPLAASVTPVNMSFTPVKKTPTANAISKYDTNAYLYSTTPSANDNSTKVATTAYVDAAIPDVSDYVSKSGDTMSGRLTLAYASSSINGHHNGGLEFTDNNNLFASLRSSGYNGSTSDYIMKLKFESGGSNDVILQGIASPSNGTDAANKAYVDSVIPQVYSSNNTSGYLTMATLPIYDGTVV